MIPSESSLLQPIRAYYSLYQLSQAYSVLILILILFLILILILILEQVWLT